MHYWEETSLPTVQPPTLPRPPLVRVADSLKAFELKTSIYPGMTKPASPNAWRLSWNADDCLYDEPDYDSDCDLTVYAPFDNIRSLGADDVAEDQRGAQGFCNDVGAIVQIEQRAKVCLAQLMADKTGSDASFSVDTITPVDGGQSPVTSSSSTLTAYNRCCGAGLNNTLCCVVFNEDTDHWEVQWIANVSQITITAVQVSGTTLQKKTRTLWGNWAGTESDWATFHTGTNCPT
jgi:hypothetical protein